MVLVVQVIRIICLQGFDIDKQIETTKNHIYSTFFMPV